MRLWRDALVRVPGAASGGLPPPARLRRRAGGAFLRPTRRRIRHEHGSLARTGGAGMARPSGALLRAHRDCGLCGLRCPRARRGGLARRARGRAGGPGRALHGQRARISDRALRHLVCGRRRRADQRQAARGRGRLDHRQCRRAGGVRGCRASRRAGGRRGARQPGRGGRAGPADRAARAAGSCLAVLHIRHHRPTQGREDHPPDADGHVACLSRRCGRGLGRGCHALRRPDEPWRGALCAGSCAARRAPHLPCLGRVRRGRNPRSCPPSWPPSHVRSPHHGAPPHRPCPRHRGARRGTAQNSLWRRPDV